MDGARNISAQQPGSISEKPPSKLAKTVRTVRGDGRGPHPVDCHVGARLRLRRMVLGVSQESLGKALGLTFQQIQKYEKGANRIGASRLYELAGLLDVPVQYFYEGIGGEQDGSATPRKGDAAMALFESPEGVQLGRNYSAIVDPEIRKRLLDLVKSLAETAAQQ